MLSPVRNTLKSYKKMRRPSHWKTSSSNPLEKIAVPPRSGTTFLQKLLARNREVFAPVLMYQTIFPSIFIQKIILGVARLGSRRDSFLGLLVTWIERRFFGGWDNMHKMRLAQPEEDDGFFVYTFATEAIYLLFPYVRLLWGAGFADDLPSPQRARVQQPDAPCPFQKQKTLASLRSLESAGSACESFLHPPLRLS